MKPIRTTDRFPKDGEIVIGIKSKNIPIRLINGEEKDFGGDPKHEVLKCVHGSGFHMWRGSGDVMLFDDDIYAYIPITPNNTLFFRDYGLERNTTNKRI